MLSKAILVVSLLFFLVEGAKYKVLNDNSRKLSKKEKINAVTQFKKHIASFTGKSASIGHATSSSLKRIEEVKKLEDWNEYDSSFSSEMWVSTAMYLSDGCDGDVSALNSEYSSFCYVETIVGSNGENYGSAQQLFKSDCSSKTYAFYASADCSGTPAAQGNTQLTGLSTSSSDECMDVTDDNDGDDDGQANVYTGFPVDRVVVNQGTAVSGGYYQYGGYISLSACELLCDTNPDCNSFTYNTRDHCALFDMCLDGSEVTTVLMGSNYRSYYRSVCRNDDDDGDDFNIEFLSAKHFCTSSAMAWNGNDAGRLQLTEYEESQTCFGEASSITHIAGGCYQTSDISSVEYAEGIVLSVYEDTTDCTGTSFSHQFQSGCAEDDDDDFDEDDDDNMIDNDMIISSSSSDGSSTDFAWITGVAQCLDYDMWSFKTKYQQGDMVFYQGALYAAQKSVKFKYPNKKPNKWEWVEPCEYTCNDVKKYKKWKQYKQYDTVLYNDMLYVARKKSKRKDPATYSSALKYRKNKWEVAMMCPNSPSISKE